MKLSDFQIVRGQSFTSNEIVSITLTHRSVRFSAACVRKFASPFYAELLVMPTSKKLAIRPCASNHKNALRLDYMKDGRFYGRVVSATAFAPVIYELFGWDAGNTYRLRGDILRNGEQIAIIFDAGPYEILLNKPRRRVLPVHFNHDFGDVFLRGGFDVEIGSEIFEHDTMPHLQPSSEDEAVARVYDLLEVMKNEKADNQS